MPVRSRMLVWHVLIGVMVAAVGLSWMTLDPDRHTQSVVFGQSDGSDALAAASGSRLVRIAETSPKMVTVTHDGTTQRLATRASSVAEVLSAAGVTLDDNDRVTPPRDAATRAGMTVEVARVEVTRRTRKKPASFDTVTRRSDELPAGERAQERPGRKGLVKVIERVVLVNGTVESRERTGARVLREPVDRVVLVGTADPGGSEPTRVAQRQSVESSEPEPEPSQSNEAPGSSPAQTAPANESPPQESASLEPAPTEPPPQEETNHTQVGKASRYADHFAGDVTASGEPYDPDALTAAHKELPLGAVVTVTNTATGESVRVRITDRGPHVAGRIIDLSRAAWNRIAPASAGIIHVRVEW